MIAIDLFFGQYDIFLASVVDSSLGSRYIVDYYICHILRLDFTAGSVNSNDLVLAFFIRPFHPQLSFKITSKAIITGFELFIPLNEEVLKRYCFIHGFDI